MKAKQATCLRPISPPARAAPQINHKTGSSTCALLSSATRTSGAHLTRQTREHTRKSKAPGQSLHHTRGSELVATPSPRQSNLRGLPRPQEGHKPRHTHQSSTIGPGAQVSPKAAEFQCASAANAPEACLTTKAGQQIRLKRLPPGVGVPYHLPRERP